MRLDRRMTAYSQALAMQHARQRAEHGLGALETYLYEARVAGEPLAIQDALKKVAEARSELHRAIDADKLAYERMRAIEEELDRRAAQRAAARARGRATFSGDAM